MRKFKTSLAALSFCTVLGAPLARAADALVTPALPAVDRSIESLTREANVYGADRARGSWQKKWAISLAPLLVSESLDAASSYGMRELNPMLAAPDGRFGMKAAVLKFGVAGGLMGVEYLLVRKYPRSAKFFTVINWTTAGATTGLAIHNYSLAGR